MDDSQELQNCWEFQNCSEDVKNNCPAYKLSLGKKCWAVASYVSDGCPKTKRGFEYCCDCLWFKKLNPNFDK